MRTRSSSSSSSSSSSKANDDDDVFFFFFALHYSGWCCLPPPANPQKHSLAFLFREVLPKTREKKTTWRRRRWRYQKLVFYVEESESSVVNTSPLFYEEFEYSKRHNDDDESRIERITWRRVLSETVRVKLSTDLLLGFKILNTIVLLLLLIGD